MNEDKPKNPKNTSFQTTTVLGIALLVVNFGFSFQINSSQNIGFGYLFGFLLLPILFLTSIGVFFRSLFLLFEIEATNSELILFLVYLITIFISIWYILPPMETPFFI